jgi:5'-3' exonuclease
MLALATHEPRFYIIREIVVTANDKYCTTCGKKGHFFTDCTIANSIEGEMKAAEKMNADSIGVTFQFVKIKAVREFIHVRYENCGLSSSLVFDL